jgi:hypothetical protein
MYRLKACIPAIAMILILVGAAHAFDLKQQAQRDADSGVPSWRDTKRFIEHNREQIADMFKQYDPVTGKEINKGSNKVEPDFDSTMAYAKKMAKSKEHYHMALRDPAIRQQVEKNAAAREAFRRLGVTRQTNLYLVASANDAPILPRYVVALSNCMRSIRRKTVRPMILLVGNNASESVQQLMSNKDAITGTSLNGSTVPIKPMTVDQVQQFANLRRLPAVIIESPGKPPSEIYLEGNFCQQLSFNLQSLRANGR